jgi:biotin-dependent carboxylase-like uncharacterized protein
MITARFTVTAAGPHVSIQDRGRSGFMRFGVPASGSMDRLAHAAVCKVLGNSLDVPVIEVSRGGIELACMAGEVSFAVAGGGFLVERVRELGGLCGGSWTTGSIKAGEKLRISSGPWGTWTYLAFAGNLEVATWLGSASTHALSGLGGGSIVTGQHLSVREPRVSGVLQGDFPCPVTARPRSTVRVVMGPQDHYVSPSSVAAFLSKPFMLSDAYDRMGVRLRGPVLALDGALGIPSEAIMRGSVQVSGDGMATVLLADHQTTGGYPKIATVVDADLDGFVQLRPRDRVAFTAITPEDAVSRARRKAASVRSYLSALAERALAG